MKTKLKFNFIFIFVILMSLIIACAQEEGSSVSVTEQLIAEKNTPDLTVDGGSVILTTDYNGKIEIKGKGGKITGIDHKKHEFNRGIIEVKNGEIKSIINADIQAFRISKPLTFSLKNEPFDVIISGSKVNYDSLTNRFTSSIEIRYGLDPDVKMYRIYKGFYETGDLIIRPKKGEVTLDFGKDLPTINGGGNTFEIYERKDKIGDFNGAMYYTNEYFFISPPEGNKFGELEIERFSGKVSGNTLFLKNEKQFVKGEILRSHNMNIPEAISSVIYNGGLDIFVTNNNQLSLTTSSNNFFYINQELIKDSSKVQVFLLGDNDFESEILFSNNKPLLKSLGSPLNIDIGTMFRSEEGELWSWEYNAKKYKIEEGPIINYLVISGLKGNVFDPVVARQQKRTIIDPLTGKILTGEILGDVVIKDILARPLIEEKDLLELEREVEKEFIRWHSYSQKEHEQEIISEGEKKHKYTIEFRVVENFEDFKESLKKPSERGNFNKIFLFMHGHPEHLGPKQGERITAKDLKDMSDEDKKQVQLNLKGVSSCTAISCSIFGNIQHPEKDNVGLELAKLIGAGEFIGSRYILYTFKPGIKSADYIKVTKEKDDFKIINIPEEK